MRTRPTLPIDWLRGLLTWLMYSTSGLATLWLAAPGHVTSPLYLAAGIGLATVLGWGRWMAAAVGLGAMTVVLTMQIVTADSLTVHAAVQSVISGAGAGLQAWLAARLVQGPTWQPLELSRPAEIGRFLLLAGPVACVVSASISVSALVMLGFMPASALPATWLRWWGGDVMGVLVGAPVMLTLVGRPEALWRARRLAVGLPLALAAVLLALAIRQLQHWEQARERDVFAHDVTETGHSLRLQLASYHDALEAMRSVYAASNVVEPDEFRRATRYWLNTLQGVQGVGWAERITRDELRVFEGHMRANGVPDYRAFDGLERRPSSGEEMVLLRYLEPLDRNRAALGFNVLSRTVTRAAFDRARREDRPVATRGFRLAQESGLQQGVVIYLPVYDGEPFTPQARVLTTRGAVFLTLRMDDAMRAMLRDLPAYLSACLLDQQGDEHHVLAGLDRCPKGAAPEGSRLQQRVPLEFAGAHWQLLVWAQGPVPLSTGQATWVLAVGGAALAAALGSLLLVMTGNARRIHAAMEEARAQRAAAESASQAKSAFLSRMSHELRTPLNAVLGFAQVMELDREHPLPPAQHTRLEAIQQAGWHLLDMIDDVLDISRLDAGQVRLDTRPVAVAEALKAVSSLVETQARQQRVTLSWPVDLAADCAVQADPTRLRQILTNLLSNAIKYNRRGGTVRIEVQPARPAGGAASVSIAVSDTGMGMSDAQQAQLFQPFNRLGRESLVPDGTGIGLVITRHLAQLMGGELRVRSEEGHGSTFTLSLPAATLSTAPAPAPVSARPTTVQPGAAVRPARTVLLVEDNATNAEVIRSALKSRPWVTLQAAATVKEAWALLRAPNTPRPELILLDINLPDASGLSLLQQVRAHPELQGTPVIVISADAMPEQIDAALAAGASCYLTKPVQMPALLQQIDELLPTR